MKSSYDLLKAAAERYPSSAIVFPDEGKSYSYAEFLKEVDACARALSAYGVGIGDRVAVYGQNSSYWMKCFFAVLKTGAVAVPVNCKAVEDDIMYMVKTAGVKLLFHLSDAPLSGKLAHNVPAVVTADGFDSFVKTGSGLHDAESVCGDLQLIMFTSGTSANPKGVMLGPEGLMNSIVDYKDTLGLSSDDVMLLNLPLSYCYGCVLICCSFCLAGANLVVSRSFAAGKTLRLIEKYHCTVLNMVPTMYQLIFSSGLMPRYDHSSVRAAVVGGSYTSLELVERMRAAFGRNSVLCGYGMTECSSWALSQRFDDPVELRGASAGWPVGNMEARIVPGYGEAENGMMQGELCLRGKAMMTGYLDAAVTAEAYDSEGWFHTGDVVKRDSQGRYWIVDRCKDMIIKGPRLVSLAIPPEKG
mgnify:CR=1 FL=1